MCFVFIDMNNLWNCVAVIKVRHLPEFYRVKRVSVPELYIIISDVNHLVLDIKLNVIAGAGGECTFVGFQGIEDFLCEFFF